MLDRETLATYLDGTLDEAARERVDAELASDAAALRQVTDQRMMDAALRVLLGGAAREEVVKQSVLAVVHGSSLQRIKARVLKVTAPERPSALALLRRFAFPGLAFAAAACLALGLWLWLPRGQKPAASYAQLSEVSERAIVTRAGHELAAGNGFALQRGDMIRVADRMVATVRFGDGTRLALGQSARLTVRKGVTADEGKRLDLHGGMMFATVSKQPAGRPLVIDTPQSSVTVVGTAFVLRAEPRSTRLEVREGLVRMTRRGDGRTVDVAAGQFAFDAAGTELRAMPLASFDAGSEVVTRDPSSWPFTADSPWNHPVGSRAVYVDVSSPELPLSSGAMINKRREGRPVFVAKAGDPLGRIFLRDNPVPFATLHIPAEAAPDDSPYAFLNLIDADHRFAYEMNGAKRRDDGDIEAHQCFRIDLRSAGVPPEQRGVNVSGVPSLAGLIRKGELAGGIRHALACIVLQAAINRNGPNGDCFVWPAGMSFKDGKWRQQLGVSGNIYLGTLLAIPASVDITRIGLGNSGPGYEIARALQDYGVYVTGAFEGKVIGEHEIKPHMGFSIEPVATDELPKNIDAQLAIAVRYLKVIDNNRPENVGGGGTPRRPLAPNFAGGAP